MTDATNPTVGGMPVGNKPAYANEVFPMSVFEPHRAQAYSNHGQTLERLAQRGGLSWCEALAILEDRDWSPCPDAEDKTRAAITKATGG
jgi:hypothetical protein